MTLFALPQPGPPAGAGCDVVAPWADCSFNMPPSDIPRNAEPPTRRMSRRVTPKLRSHKSLPGWPGMQSIDMAEFLCCSSGKGTLRWGACGSRSVPQTESFKGGEQDQAQNTQSAIRPYYIAVG